MTFIGLSKELVSPEMNEHTIFHLNRMKVVLPLKEIKVKPTFSGCTLFTSSTLSTKPFEIKPCAKAQNLCLIALHPFYKNQSGCYKNQLF